MKTLKCEICGTSVEEEDGFDKSCVCKDCLFQCEEIFPVTTGMIKRYNIIQECISVLKENKRHPVIDECIRQLEVMK